MNTHIYYHCNRIKKYDCPEPYITEEELIKQLIVLLPDIRLNTKYMMQEFEIEMKRLQHLKLTVLNKQKPVVETTPHNVNENDDATTEYNDLQKDMLHDYLLHVLQFGTPEERIKILRGVKSRCILSNRLLTLS